VVFDTCLYSFQKRADDVLIQMAICDSVEKRLDNRIPPNVIDMVLQIALHSTDPDHEAWQSPAENGVYYYNGDPHSKGINTARGRAVRVYSQLILNGALVLREPVVETLQMFADDVSSAVRACLIEFLPYVPHFDNKRSVEIFNKAVEGRPELLESSVSYNYIQYALGHNTLEMLPRIESLSESKLDKVREVAGRLATIAYLINTNTKEFYNRYLEGDSQMRKGVAAVLARNVDQSDLQKICVYGLTKLMQDSDKSVREQAGQVFEYLPSPIDEIEDFVNNFLNSPALEDSARLCMGYAERNHLEFPETSLHIAEIILNKFDKDFVNFQKTVRLLDDNLVNLSVSIQTHNDDVDIKSRALDLFERAMDLGSYYARKVLEEVDR
jgi:hypothetical protein